MAHLLVDESKQLSRCLFAVASEERRALLSLLLAVETPDCNGLTITQLANAAGLSRFTASRHLGVLRDSGLVNLRCLGTKKFHRIDFDGVASIEDWIEPYSSAAYRLASAASTVA